MPPHDRGSRARPAAVHTLRRGMGDRCLAGSEVAASSSSIARTLRESAFQPSASAPFESAGVHREATIKALPQIKDLGVGGAICVGLCSAETGGLTDGRY